MSLTPLYVITGAAIAAWISNRITLGFERSRRNFVEPPEPVAPPTPKEDGEPKPLRPKILPPLRFTLVSWQRHNDFCVELDLIDEKLRETLTVRSGILGFRYNNGVEVSAKDQVEMAPFIHAISWGMHLEKERPEPLPKPAGEEKPEPEIHLDPLPEDMVNRLLSKPEEAG